MDDFITEIQSDELIPDYIDDPDYIEHSA